MSSRQEKDLDRIKVVTNCMQDYFKYGKVQEAGCDAFITFAREGRSSTPKLAVLVSGLEG